MNNLVINNSIVPFEAPNIKLTEAQIQLLIFLKERIKSNLPINKDDILEFYLKYVKKKEGENEAKQKWNGTEWYYVTVYTTFRSKWNIKTQAINWFKNNLGAVIIKGKILIIPTIEL